MKKTGSRAEIMAPKLWLWRWKYIQGLILSLFLLLFFVEMELPKIWKLQGKQEAAVAMIKKEDLWESNLGTLLAQKWSLLRSDGNSNKEGSHRTGSITLQRMAEFSWKRGKTLWKELMEAQRSSSSSSSSSSLKNLLILSAEKNDNNGHICRESIAAINGIPFTSSSSSSRYYLALPCGLSIGSSITIIGKPIEGHYNYTDGNNGGGFLQFAVELHGEREEGERRGEWPSPTLLHLNPRIERYQSSNLSVIEQNCCFRGQWGAPQICQGVHSTFRDGMVDGLLKCESWLEDTEEKKKSSRWLHELPGMPEKTSTNLHYPFSLNHTFVLTIRAGWEGYHTNIDGKHITSFPHHTEFWEETAGLSIHGDVNISSIFLTSLPLLHPNPADEKFSEMWKVPPKPKTSVFLFVGILSSSNHFKERMAMRKTWMQSSAVRNSEVVPRFFVALHQITEINLQMKEEADFYGDMVILPFMDHYDLVVLKTLAICEYGVKNLFAKYIMKCDDDTFVRLDAVLNEVKNHGNEERLYLGNINVLHKPFRTGKWAIRLEEWPDDVYPPYANGPGYIISRSVAEAIVLRLYHKDLELFKMEDVNMGMWLQQLNETEKVKYAHTWRFCQDNCANGCLTAHHQSPRQMICMWKKLLRSATTICCPS